MLESVTIRPVLPDELHQVAAVHAVSFGGDENKILDRLANNPRYNSSHIIVADYEGQIIASSTLFPAQMWLSGVPINVGAIAGVAVVPPFRRKGLAAKLMEFSVVRMLAEGRALAVLFPFSHKYYRQYGFGTVGDLHAYRIATGNLIVYPEARKVRPFTPGDLPVMRVMYKGQLTWHNGWFTRSNSWWDRLIEIWPHVMVYDNDGSIEGYYAYDFKIGPQGESVLHIIEFFAAEDEAYRGLIGYLAVQNEADVIEYLAPPDTPLRHSLHQPKADNAENRGWIFNDLCHITPAVMARIINLPAALTARFYARYMQGERVLKIHDPLIPTNEQPLIFRLIDGRAETRLANGERKPQVETDIGTLSQILCGYMPAVHARRLGRLQADEDTCAWLDKAISDSPLYIQAGDWF